jgi:hypothetical protein
MYSQLSKISSAIQICDLGYLSSGNSTWARMWGSVVMFRRQNGSASKIFGNTDVPTGTKPVTSCTHCTPFNSYAKRLDFLNANFTRRIGVFPDKLTEPRLGYKFPAFCSQNPDESSAPSSPVSWYHILKLFSHPRPASNRLLFPSGLPTKIPYASLFSAKQAVLFNWQLKIYNSKLFKILNEINGELRDLCCSPSAIKCDKIK